MSWDTAMRRALALAGCLFAALALSAPAWGAPGLESCFEGIARAPREIRGYLCALSLGYDPATRALTVRALEARLALDARDPRASLVLGDVLLGSGDARIEALYRTAIEGLDREREPVTALWAVLSLAKHLEGVHRLDEARDALDDAVRRARATNDALVAARTLWMRGSFLGRRALHGAAELDYREALLRAGNECPKDLRAHLENGLGVVAWSTGRTEDALAHFLEQTRLLEELGDRRAAGRARYNVLLVSSRIEAWNPEALAAFRERLLLAIEDAHRSGDHIIEAQVRLGLASLPIGDASEKLAQNEIALRLIEQANDGGAREAELLGQALRAFARALVIESRANAPRALAVLERASALARSNADVAAEARVELIRGLIARALGDGAMEEKAWQAAMRAVESVRLVEVDPLTRARVLSPWIFVYQRAVGAYLHARLGDGERVRLDAALRAMERGRARVLTEQLEVAGSSLDESASEALGIARRTLLDRLAATQRRLREVGDDALAREPLLRDIEELEVSERRVRAEILRERGQLAPLYAPEIPSLDAIEGALADDEALVSYQLATTEVTASKWYDNGGSWAIVVTRAGSRAIPLADEDELRRTIDLFTGMLVWRDGREARAARRLHKELIAPVLGALPESVTRIAVVADGAMHRLPFESLAGDTESAPFGIAYRVARVPSIALWWRWRHSVPRGADIPVLSLGVSGTGTLGSRERGSGALEALGRLGPLPEAAREAHAVASHLGGGSESRVDRAATETLVKKLDLSRFRVIHVAAHAVSDDARPERSAVVLMPGESGDDGLLQMREIVELDLRDRVIVLSACRGADGELVAGEGALSLASAFFGAGARAVVASLWPLDDREAAALVDGFARELGRGKSLGESLRVARASLRDAGAPPAAWAGLVLIGDDAIVPAPRGTPRPMPLAVVVGALAAMTAALTLVARRALTPPGAGKKLSGKGAPMDVPSESGRGGDAGGRGPEPDRSATPEDDL